MSPVYTFAHLLDADPRLSVLSASGKILALVVIAVPIVILQVLEWLAAATTQLPPAPVIPPAVIIVPLTLSASSAAL